MSTKKNVPTTSDEILEMLRRHHNLDVHHGRPAGGILAHEIQAPSEGRRADALWAPVVDVHRRAVTLHPQGVSTL